MPPKFKNILSNSLRVTMDIAAETVGKNPQYFKEILNISLNEKPPINWRASRVIALCTDKYPDLFIPYVNKIAQLFPSFKNDGLKRSYAYVLSKYVKYFNEDNQAGLIEICFNYMLSDEKVAVKYNCMKLLFEMTEIIPELKGELQAAIGFNISEDIFRMTGEIKKIYKAIDV
ncbi:MAG: hypothetical protein L3J35_01940 [Bacteroidales bacterium]|nr:hypothetical protein [Bacteroidales bacterium]